MKDLGKKVLRLSAFQGKTGVIGHGLIRTKWTLILSQDDDLLRNGISELPKLPFTHSKRSICTVALLARAEWVHRGSFSWLFQSLSPAANNLPWGSRTRTRAGRTEYKFKRHGRGKLGVASMFY